MHDHTLTSAPIDWDRYRLVIFDMDGTLYRQRPVQVAMAAKLLADALLTRRTTTLRTVRAFRHCRETLLDGSTDLARDQYAVSAGMLGTTAEAVRAVTERWIEQEPLGILGRHRLAGVAELFASLRERGKTIAILSDYPAAAKLAALGLDAHFIACATDPDINRLKPHPRGIETLLQRAGVNREQCLMIGDRDDRDGEAARRAGVDCLILSRRASAANHFCHYNDPRFAALSRPTNDKTRRT